MNKFLAILTALLATGCGEARKGEAELQAAVDAFLSTELGLGGNFGKADVTSAADAHVRTGPDSAAPDQTDGGLDGATGNDVDGPKDGGSDAGHDIEVDAVTLDTVGCVPPTCDDGKPCTTDSCSISGSCQHVDNSLVCNDGNACTGTDLCASGTCAGTKTVDCDDSNFCTLDTCDVFTGCSHVAKTGPCADDGKPCTQDICQGGKCTHPAQSEGSPCPDDGDKCTADVCVSGVCSHPANPSSSLCPVVPQIKGTYVVVTSIDLFSVLPASAQVVFKTIADLTTDSVAGSLSLACKLGGGSLDSLCGYVFSDKANPSIKNMTAIGDIVTKFLNAILLSYLPESVKAGLSTGADLGEILTNLEMGGTIEIKAEPDNAGFLPASQTKQLWSTVTYKWTLGQTCAANDPNCGKKSFNIEAFQSEAIVGQFDLWRGAILSQVKIGKHSLKVKWGALINYIVQKQLLPAMTKDPKNPSAPVIDSYAKLLKSLMGGKQCLVKDTCCNDFAKQLAAKQSLMNEGFLTSTCEVLVNVGTGFLEAQLNKLDGDSGDPTKGSGLQLSADGCNIYETNQDQLIDLFGSPQPKDQCTWDMTLTIGGSPLSIKGKFYATRQQ